MENELNRRLSSDGREGTHPSGARTGRRDILRRVLIPEGKRKRKQLDQRFEVVNSELPALVERYENLSQLVKLINTDGIPQEYWITSPEDPFQSQKQPDPGEPIRRLVDKPSTNRANSNYEGWITQLENLSQGLQDYIDQVQKDLQFKIRSQLQLADNPKKTLKSKLRDFRELIHMDIPKILLDIEGYQALNEAEKSLRKLWFRTSDFDASYQTNKLMLQKLNGLKEGHQQFRDRLTELAKYIGARRRLGQAIRDAEIFRDQIQTGLENLSELRDSQEYHNFDEAYKRLDEAIDQARRFQHNPEGTTQQLLEQILKIDDASNTFRKKITRAIEDAMYGPNKFSGYLEQYLIPEAKELYPSYAINPLQTYSTSYQRVSEATKELVEKKSNLPDLWKAYKDLLIKRHRFESTLSKFYTDVSGQQTAKKVLRSLLEDVEFDLQAITSLTQKIESSLGMDITEIRVSQHHLTEAAKDTTNLLNKPTVFESDLQAAYRKVNASRNTLREKVSSKRDANDTSLSEAAQNFENYLGPLQKRRELHTRYEALVKYFLPEPIWFRQSSPLYYPNVLKNLKNPSGNPSLQKKLEEAFTPEETQEFIRRLENIHDNYTHLSINSINIEELDNDIKWLTKTLERLKFKNALKYTYSTIQKISDAQKTIAMTTMPKYFAICSKNLQDCIEKAEHYLESDQVNSQATPKELEDLIESDRELDKALNILQFREDYPTSEDILREDRLPNNISEEYKENARSHWTDIAQRRLERSLERKPTKEELEKYLDEIFLPELHQKAKKLIENTKICICLRPDILIKILRDGRVKTVFETEISGASISSNPENRSKAENRLFGYPKDLPVELRPIYGYLTDDPSDDVLTDQFGSAIIVLKDVERITITMDDSLVHGGIEDDWASIRPVSYNNPSGDCFPLGRQSLVGTRMIENNEDPLELNSICDVSPWVEAQIHGGVTIDNIAKVVFRKTELLDDGLKKELINLLEQNGIFDYEFIQE